MLDAKKASPDFVPDIFSSDGTGPLSVRGSAGNGNDDVRIDSHFLF